MSGGTLVLLAGTLSAAVTLMVLLRARRPRARRLRGPAAMNYRGRRLPIVLGLGITAGIFVAVCAVLVADNRQHRLVHSARETVEILAALLLVFAGGLLDDVQPARFHGLVRHFGELVQGRVTSGIIKMGTAVAAAAAFGLATHQSGIRLSLGIPFVAGAGLLLRLSTPGLAVALAVVVALHLLGETVTLTRLIRGVAPIRWLDDLGRLREADRRPESSAPA